MTIRVWLIAVVRRTSSVKRQKEARDHGVRRLTINEHYLRINTRQGKLSSSLFTPLPLLLSRRSPGDVSGAAFLLAVHSSQLTAYCSLLTVHCLLFTAYCSLFTVPMTSGGGAPGRHPPISRFSRWLGPGLGRPCGRQPSPRQLRRPLRAQSRRCVMVKWGL